MNEEIKGKCYQEHEPTPNNPCEIKTILCNDIEIPVEFLKHNFVIVDEKKYIKLQQLKQQLEQALLDINEYIETNSYFKDNIVKTMVLGDYSKGILDIVNKALGSDSNE